MKNTIYFTIAISFLLFSCDTSNMPEIDFQELGLENSKTAIIGEELHMEADILAENTIDKIEVEIHPEGEYHKKSSLILEVSDEWETDTIYTRFSGLKNTLFHEHLEIPETAEAGHYHFHFTVTDMEGYQTVYEDEVELLTSEMK